MNYSDITGITSGVLQLAVAIYALRLSRRFGTERVGWLVFGAFFLLATIHSLLALDLFRGTLGPAVVTDFTYILVSILLLTSIARLESSLNRHRQTTTEQRRNLCEWESQVEAQVVDLNRSNEELRKVGTKLQAEIAELKQAHEQACLAHEQACLSRDQACVSRDQACLLRDQACQSRDQDSQTFQSLLTAARQTEKDLQQTVSLLQSEIAEQKKEIAEQQNLQVAAHRSGIADLAASLLESVNALSALAGDQARSRSARTVRAVKLLHKRPTPTSRFLITPRRKLPVAITQLVRQLSDGQSELLQKIESLKGKLEHARDCGAIAVDLEPASLQPIGGEVPASSEVSPAASTEVLPSTSPAEHDRAAFHEHLIENVTETGTESSEHSQQASAAPESVEETSASEKVHDELSSQ